jgi:hypothetical protein
VYVDIQEADLVTRSRERYCEVHCYRALADATLAREHEELVFDDTEPVLQLLPLFEVFVRLAGAPLF